ncbi:hypothetical protein SHKM778_76680 [Streptomyces sp. KM77-8]|uniref:4Fe-4S Mo/W bis-MGD-type domain-containing protein n=1 Tax=Streptomyces haneummycinicus TaxID=3074435 RepID=A0AAT9HVX3_9ACTN
MNPPRPRRALSRVSGDPVTEAHPTGRPPAPHRRPRPPGGRRTAGVTAVGAVRNNRGAAWGMRETVTPTHCPYCALQCGMNLTPAPDGRGVEVSERVDFPVNRGRCAGRGGPRPPCWRPVCG